MPDFRHWRSLRDLDVAAGAAKGAAFRAFKALEPALEPERDFVVLDRESAQGLVQSFYATSVRLILLAPPVAERVLQALRQPRLPPAALPPASGGE